MNKKIKEGLEMDLPTYKKIKGTLDPKTPIRITSDKPSNTSSMSMGAQMEENEMVEPEAVIEPQDQATIKYLSNVKDANSGEISQPFNIGDKKYQMVRGMNQDKEVILGVYCFDDVNEAGENIIHSMEYFEENIANPMKEQMGMVGQDIAVVEKENEYDYAAAEREFHDKQDYEKSKSDDFADDDENDDDENDDRKTVDEDTYEGFKHYLVNRQTNEVRKFKTIEEILSCDKSAEEQYMGVGSFKKYMNERLFGARKRKDETLNEVMPTGEESDEEMNAKAKKLMDMIGKRIPTNIIKTIKTPIAQREVIAAFAELIGVPRNGLSKLIIGLKDLSKQSTQPQAEPTPQAEPQAITEKKVITKNMLENKVKKIKVIKVKDLQ
jgi:hypothetical protein